MECSVGMFNEVQQLFEFIGLSRFESLLMFWMLFTTFTLIKKKFIDHGIASI